MKTNKSYTELNVWKEARKLVKIIYKLTERLPDKEKFNLTSQLQRASVSIVSNISEGIGRNTKKDTAQFMFMSRGSAYELETQLFLCIDLEYLSEKALEEAFMQIETVKKLISGFINYLQKD
jgi:four helix bundle protein